MKANNNVVNFYHGMIGFLCPTDRPAGAPKESKLVLITRSCGMNHMMVTLKTAMQPRGKILREKSLLCRVGNVPSCCCIFPAYFSQIPPALSVQIRICLSPACKRNEKTFKALFTPHFFYTVPKTTKVLTNLLVQRNSSSGTDR